MRHESYHKAYVLSTSFSKNRNKMRASYYNSFSPKEIKHKEKSYKETTHKKPGLFFVFPQYSGHFSRIGGQRKEYAHVKQHQDLRLYRQGLHRTQRHGRVQHQERFPRFRHHRSAGGQRQGGARACALCTAQLQFQVPAEQDPRQSQSGQPD